MSTPSCVYICNSSSKTFGKRRRHFKNSIGMLQQRQQQRDIAAAAAVNLHQHRARINGPLTRTRYVLPVCVCVKVVIQHILYVKYAPNIAKYLGFTYAQFAFISNVKYNAQTKVYTSSDCTLIILFTHTCSLSPLR